EARRRARGRGARGRAADHPRRSPPDRGQRAPARQAAGEGPGRRGGRRPDPGVVSSQTRGHAMTDGFDAERAAVGQTVDGDLEVGRAGSATAPGALAPSGTRMAERRPRRGCGIATLITILIVLLGGAAVVGAFLLSPPSATPASVEFEVLPGWGGKRVAAELAEAGLVRSAPAFEYYLRFRDLDHSIGEGLYDLDPTMSAREVAASLVAGGRPRVTRIVLPEGVRAAEVVDRLVAGGIASRDELQSAIDDPGLELAPPYAPADQSLEGYLFPAVYEVPVHATAEQALRQMVDRFRAEVSDHEDLARRL